MRIQVNIEDDHPHHPLKSFTLDADSIQLIPQAGDQITDGQTIRTVKGRVFQYGPGEIIVTLDCKY
jgi:hypothetical protein